MNTNKIKLIAIALFLIPMLALIVFKANTTAVHAINADSDEATIASYKKNCMACHGPTALKLYDPELTMEEQVEAILKGKKGQKPPHMPAYETKGINAEQALALAEHMKALRTPATD